jgi:NAD(P)-dependent dehydrogenase (short-subunit alcohol dehydrogenase family)
MGPTPLTDQVALITGAARGLGEAQAKALGAQGAKVMLVARSTEEQPNPVSPGSLDAVNAALQASGVDSDFLRGDLANADDIAMVTSKTLERFGRVDILINNAVFAPISPFLDIPPRRWTTAFQVNVVAPVMLAQAFLPGMLERGQGAVVNIGSVSSKVALPGYAAFGTTRAAIERVAMAIAAEFGDRGVDSYTIRIEELIDTVGQQVVRGQNRSGGATTESLERARSQIQRGGRWTAEDFGGAVAWLLTNRPEVGDERVFQLGDLQKLGALPDVAPLGAGETPRMSS